MITIDPATAATFVTVLLAMIAGTFRLGKLSNRVDRLESAAEQLRKGQESLQKGRQEMLILLHTHLGAHRATVAQPANGQADNPPPTN